MSERIKFSDSFSFYLSSDYGNIVVFANLKEINLIRYSYFNWGYIPDCYIDEHFIDKLWNHSIKDGRLVYQDARLVSPYPIYDVDKYNERLNERDLESLKPKEIIFTNSMAGAMLGHEKISIHKV